jgi:hypothetical protein
MICKAKLLQGEDLAKELQIREVPITLNYSSKGAFLGSGSCK